MRKKHIKLFSLYIKYRLYVGVVFSLGIPPLFMFAVKVCFNCQICGFVDVGFFAMCTIILN